MEQVFNIKCPSPELNLATSCVLNPIELTVKRDDLLHPIISGNKWRKLKYHLTHAQSRNIQHIISFGGGFSNHLHALGYCCFKLNIKFTAMVRGNYSNNLTPMLNDLIDWNTKVEFVDKSTYQARDTSLKQQLQVQFPDAWIIPEGGSSDLALKGIADIVKELTQKYDYILAPVASGGTLAGLIKACNDQSAQTKVIGIAALKGEGYLESLVQNLLSELQPSSNTNWQINHDFHFGGYAKKTPELVQFCQQFFQQNNIAIEPVYSGKLFYAIHTLLEQNYFKPNSKILALHTGGLQGAR